MMSKEDYLERILMLHKTNTIVRAIDIANDLNYSKASVSIAMKKLKNLNLIEINEKTGNISLTDEGEKIALRVFERHHIITQVLVSLGVSLETAKEDACKIEHDLSDEAFNALKNFYNQTFSAPNCKKYFL